MVFSLIPHILGGKYQHANRLSYARILPVLYGNGRYSAGSTATVLVHGDGVPDTGKAMRVCEARRGEAMKLRKLVEQPRIIECPYCGCQPSNGFDCVDHEDYGDDFVRDVYSCPKCKKTSTRCYEFYAWENADGEELEEV